MKSRCGFYSKLEYWEGMVEEFGGEVGELGGKLPPPPPPPPPVDETLTAQCAVEPLYSGHQWAINSWSQQRGGCFREMQMYIISQD